MSAFTSAFLVLGLTVFFFVAQAALRRCGMETLFLLFGVVPAVLTPFWIKTNEFDPFLWVKIYSIMFCVCWGSWLRFTSHGKTPWLRCTIGWLLMGNILEAVIVDLASISWCGTLNALAGILLIVALPFGSQSTGIDREAGYRDIRFDTSLRWIVGYSVWNWTFVYLNYPALLGHHTAILSTALIVAVVDPQRWLQTRAVTLGLNLMFMATNFTGTKSIIDANEWFNKHFAIVATVVSLSWAIVVATARIESKPVDEMEHSCGCCLAFRF